MTESRVIFASFLVDQPVTVKRASLQSVCYFTLADYRVCSVFVCAFCDTNQSRQRTKMALWLTRSPAVHYAERAVEWRSRRKWDLPAKEKWPSPSSPDSSLWPAEPPPYTQQTSLQTGHRGHISVRTTLL